MSARIPLRQLAHGRSGDKGDRLNVSVIAKDSTDYPHLLRAVTVAHVAQVYRHLNPSQITRYELPTIGALNFVLDDALDGGVNSALAVDRHGKTQASLLFDALIDMPDE